MPATMSASGHDITPLTEEQIRVLAADLSDEEARIILRQGTEAPFCGTLLDNKKTGVYLCRLCGLPLFGSDAKFTSGTGWPSFFQPVDDAHVTTIEDTAHGMVRTEIRCARCGGHLGHVFPDGPPPTGRRYCLNATAMAFLDDGEAVPERSRPTLDTQTAYFAGGCFWGVEDRFQQIAGVIDAASGYQGGHTDDPSYREVCSKSTGHAESVRVIFDPSRVTYAELLRHFFEMHNPTTPNRQGPDVGSQYRSAIFTVGEAQQCEAEAYVAALSAQPKYADRPIVTQIIPAPTFHMAEEHHQDYNAKHGRSCGV